MLERRDLLTAMNRKRGSLYFAVSAEDARENHADVPIFSDCKTTLSTLHLPTHPLKQNVPFSDSLGARDVNVGDQFVGYGVLGAHSFVKTEELNSHEAIVTTQLFGDSNTPQDAFTHFSYWATAT